MKRGQFSIPCGSPVDEARARGSSSLLPEPLNPLGEMLHWVKIDHPAMLYAQRISWIAVTDTGAAKARVPSTEFWCVTSSVSATLLPSKGCRWRLKHGIRFLQGRSSW
jgi:hypothetical protein